MMYKENSRSVRRAKIAEECGSVRWLDTIWDKIDPPGGTQWDTAAGWSGGDSAGSECMQKKERKRLIFNELLPIQI